MSYPEHLDTPAEIQALLNKKEFAQLAGNKAALAARSITPEHNEPFLDVEIMKENLLTLHSHQLFVRNLMNPDTPYTRLFLKHATGTGKTIASLSIVLTFLKYYQTAYNLTRDSGQTPMIFIIGFSKQIFQRELLRRPEFGFVTKDEIKEFTRLRFVAEHGSAADKSVFAEFEIRIKKRLSKKERGGFFKFYGYKEFFNQLFIFSEHPEHKEESGLSEDQIVTGLRNGNITLNLELIDAFANSIIICDEIHNAYNSVEINNYGIAIQMILDIYDSPDVVNTIAPLSGKIASGRDRIAAIKNSMLRVIFMSATPVNNSPTEIIDLLNMLVPLSRLPEKKKLVKDDFFIDQRNLRPGALEKIQSAIQGYVSFLRDDNPKYFPERKFEGEEITIPRDLRKNRVAIYTGSVIPYLKFIRCPMSDIHQRTYDALLKVPDDMTLPPDGQTITDLVLPNPGLLGESTLGLYRTKDIKYSLVNANQKWKDENMIALDKMAGTNTYMITGEFMKLETLKRYSTKYAEIIKHAIRNLESDSGKVIISHQSVRMSGVLFIQEMLRRNGIIDEYSSPTDHTLCSRCGKTRITHKANHDYVPARSIIYHGDLDKATLDRSLEKYKSIENIDGYYFRFFIGSKIINEGIDFNAVQNIWLVNAPANYPTIVQIFGRAIRQKSHIALPPEKRRVVIKVFVSSLRGSRSADELSYEERKYFDKSQDYIVIQTIEKIFNENAIDAVIHRSIIMPEEQKQLHKKAHEDLGALYFDPAPVFGKRWLQIAANERKLRLSNTTTTTFNIYHADEEVNTILYIIKRLFIEQSPVWKYNDLWQTVKAPPFELHVNPELFAEPNFLVALHSLIAENQTIDTYQIVKRDDSSVSRLFDHFDKHIVINGRECQIVHINGYFILFPVNHEQEDPDEESIGMSSVSLIGAPDVDIDNWYRHTEATDNTSLRITKYLRTSNISYNQMKFKFYNQFKDYTPEELPISTEVYDIDFHSRLIEDSIRYAFNVLTNPDMPISELHNFYFKMLYFYNRLELILFADHLSATKLYERYKRFVTHANLKFDVYDESRKHAKPVDIGEYDYNPFLMSSLIKSSGDRTFNLGRLNAFVGKPEHARHRARVEDMNVAKQFVRRRNVRRVFSNMLPVGHFLNTSMESSGVLAIPKIYIAEQDPDIIDDASQEQKSGPWVKAYEFVKHYEPVNCVENDIIVGYYEKNPTSIDIKFKTRLPVQKTEIFEDSRMIERGSTCSTKKKEELIKMAGDLGITVQPNVNIKAICSDIKFELMNREMKERKKYAHMTPAEREKHKRVKWFYLAFEPQIQL